MRLARYLTILFVLSVASYYGFWYYQMNKFCDEINTKYSSKKLLSRGVDSKEYYMSFVRATPYGFPFPFGVKIEGWKEESLTADIDYTMPIYFIYDLLKQKIEVRYNGEIIAAYKPVNTKFGARLNINDYFISADLKITKSLIDTLNNLKDPFEIINHIGEVKVGTGNVKIFDLNDGQEFYNKEYEQLNLSFLPRKYYTSFEDFLDNFPEKIVIDYAVKTKDTNALSRRIPTSLFYGFYTLPNDFKANAKLSIKARSPKYDELFADSDINLNCEFKSKYLDLNSYSLEYDVNSNSKDNINFALVSKSDLRIKEGFFDELFRQYISIRGIMSNNPYGRVLAREIEYMHANKDLFKFKDMENSRYDIDLGLTGVGTPKMIDVNLKNFSIMSELSGIKLAGQINMQNHSPHFDITNPSVRKFWSKGILYIKNYVSIIDFFSNYIYRFGKYRILTEKVREIYATINKKFFKKISDNPNSSSNDLSFSYEVSSDKLDQAKFGSVKISQLEDLYQASIINSLVDEIDLKKDIFLQMKQIIPELDENSELVKRLIPKLKHIENIDIHKIPSSASEIIKKSGDLEKNLDKIIPKEVRKNIDSTTWNKLLK